MTKYDNLKMVTEKIKIDIVSDVVCPWCIIGYKRLEKAISEMGIQDQVEIEWQPFELNPQMPVEGENVTEHITRKYGTTPDDGKRSKANMAKLGEELNFTFDYFDDMRIVNTIDAHVLLDYAHEEEKQTELSIRFVEAFFSERKDISKRDVLLQELQSVGLDVDEATRRLESGDVHEHIKTKETYWKSRGVSSVPTIVFNEVSGVTGAQPVAVYKQVLTGLIKEQR